MGWVTTTSVLLLGFIVGKIAQLTQSKTLLTVSTKLRYLAEYILCYSIYFLLWAQRPWLKIEENFHAIYPFYEKYKTRKIMFVANHRSNLDTFILISRIPGLRGMAKKSLFYNVFFAPSMYLMGFVPVEKGSVAGFLQGIHLLKEKILEKNNPALVFPETTRCRKNNPGINKWSDAVFQAAIQSESLLVPILIQNTDQSMGKGDLFVHPGHTAKLKLYDPIEAKTYSSARDLSQQVYQFLLDQNRMSV